VQETPNALGKPHTMSCIQRKITLLTGKKT